MCWEQRTEPLTVLPSSLPAELQKGRKLPGRRGMIYHDMSWMSDLNSCHQSSKINSAIGNFDRPPAGNGLVFPSFFDKAKKSPHLPHSWNLPHTLLPTAGLLGHPSSSALGPCSVLRASADLSSGLFPARAGAATPVGSAVQEQMRGVAAESLLTTPAHLATARVIK